MKGLNQVSDTMTVGVVGTGKMGKPMTENLLKAGYQVVVHNRSQKSVDALVKAGATNGGSPALVAKEADIIITSLPDPNAVREVYLRATTGLSRMHGRARSMSTRARSILD